MDDFRTLLQRSVYEHLRLVVVAQGFTPDITTYENTPLGYQHYLADLKLIQVNKGFSVEIFNQSSVRAKGVKKVPRIVLDYVPIGPGDWGSEGKAYPEPSGTGFKYYRDDLVSLEMLFYLRLVTESTTQSRTLNQLCLQVFPPLVFIPYYSDPDEFFLIEFVSQSEVIDPQMNTKEFVSLYKIPDIIANEAVYTGQEVPGITNIEIENRLGL